MVGRGGRRARYVTPDLSYYWEGAREQCEEHKWDGQKQNAKKCKKKNTSRDSSWQNKSVFFLPDENATEREN